MKNFFFRKKTGRNYPLISTKKQLNNSLKKHNLIISKNLTKSEIAKITNIKHNFDNKITTFTKYYTDGKLNPERRKLHDKIIRKTFKDKSTIDKKDPDLYIVAGLPGSGKSTVLRSRIKENAVIIDSDEFKSQLANVDKSPIKRFPLAHASLLHDESDIIVTRSLNKAIKERRDVVYDKTFASYEGAQSTIERFKKAGYDVHLLSTQMYPHQAILSITNRFLVNGRFVSPSNIINKGEEISKNAIKLRNDTDSHLIYDTNDIKKPVLISKSKYNMEHNFRDPPNC